MRHDIRHLRQCGQPDELHKAIHKAVAACQPSFRPRHYAHDWQEELYHEAACAACEAWHSYNPARGSLYDWGLRLIRQHLKRFSDGVWVACRCEAEWPCDEETGEALEVEDSEAFVVIEEGVLCSQVREALARLSEAERQLLEGYLGDELSEQAIAKRLKCSHVAVHQRLRRAWGRLCKELGMELPFPARRGKKSSEKGGKSE